MSSMDLDRSLDDLIKQKKNSKPKRNVQHQQQKTPKKQQQQRNRGNTSFQTNAKIKKISTAKPKSDIISRLSTTTTTKLFTTHNNKPNKTDPSQIIITKAVPSQSLKNRLGPNAQKESTIVAPVRSGKVSSILSNRLGSRQQEKHMIPTQEPPRSYERQMAEDRFSLSIRGRSNAATAPSGLSIKGESGPTTVLISGLDRGTNSEDIRMVCEEFGNVLRCEVLRNRMGESFGEAEVEFSTKSAALDCVAKLDNVKADGQYLRVILRDSKPSAPRSYAASQISSIISAPSTSSGKMYSDQIPSRYGIIRR